MSAQRDEPYLKRQGMIGEHNFHPCDHLPIFWRTAISFCGWRVRDEVPGLILPQPLLRLGYCAGIVINGSLPVSPVSASVKKNMTAVRGPLGLPVIVGNPIPVAMKRTAVNASAGFSLPL